MRDGRIIADVLWYGSWITAARTLAFGNLAFGNLAFAQLAHALNAGSTRHSVFRLGLWSNPRLLAAITFSAAAQLVVLYAPFAYWIFHTTTSGRDVALAACFSISPLVFGEVLKALRRRAAPPSEAVGARTNSAEEGAGR